MKKKISIFFQIFKAQLSSPLAFWCNGWVWISNYIMSGIQKPSLQVKMSNGFVARAISITTFHYGTPCMCPLCMYGARNLEMSIRFSLKSRPSERFHRPEMSQIKAEISVRTNMKLNFHKNVGCQWYQWIPDFLLHKIWALTIFSVKLFCSNLML